MKLTNNSRKGTPAEEIARLADRGEDVSRFFTNSGRMMEPIRRVNVDFASPMLKELDRIAQELNISRQAVIKTLIRQALDQRYLARSARRVRGQAMHGPTVRRPFPCWSEFLRSCCAGGQRGLSSPPAQRRESPASYTEISSDRRVQAGSRSSPPPTRCAVRRQ